MTQPRTSRAPRGAPVPIDAASLRRKREALGLTRDQLATAANVTRPYVSMLESGKRRQVAGDIASLLADALRCDVAAIAAVPIPDTLTVTEAAEIMRCHPETVRKRHKAGALVGEIVAGRLLLTRRSVVAHLGAAAEPVAS